MLQLFLKNLDLFPYFIIRILGIETLVFQRIMGFKYGRETGNHYSPLILQMSKLRPRVGKCFDLGCTDGKQPSQILNQRIQSWREPKGSSNNLNKCPLNRFHNKWSSCLCVMTSWRLTHYLPWWVILYLESFNFLIIFYYFKLEPTCPQLLPIVTTTAYWG